MQYYKPKSVGKIIISDQKELNKYLLSTLKEISNIVGCTLGPGGRPVLIERQEVDLKPIVTKDGVTVIKYLSFKNPIKQIILETAIDASVRTAVEAGDGTTTAVLLLYGIVSQISAHLKKINHKISPQKILREMNAIIPEINNFIDKYVINIDSDNYHNALFKIAMLSSNGDEELSNYIIKAIELIGAEGNITITESVGKSHCELEKIHGYAIDMGYEETCKKFSNGFINDKSGTMVVLEKPVVLLYDGIITDTIQILDAINKLNDYFIKIKSPYKNIVIVAHGFSDLVLGDLHLNWSYAETVNVFPLLTPTVGIVNWKTNFLYDLQAYTGSPVFNPIDNPITNLSPERLIEDNLVQYFEAGRFRSTILSKEDPELILDRVEQLKLQLENPESEFERYDLNVRIGKLTSGIAKLTIYAPSQAETRERRDRAEDAWLSVKSAIKHGAVPAGGFILCKLYKYLHNKYSELSKQDKDINLLSKKLAYKILYESVILPVKYLYINYGYNTDETNNMIQQLILSPDKTFDILKQQWVDTTDLMESKLAVTEALSNSIFLSGILGTVGGIVSFDRDISSDLKESRGFYDVLNHMNNSEK